MPFNHTRAAAGRRVLIHGTAGKVGAHAVQPDQVVRAHRMLEGARRPKRGKAVLAASRRERKTMPVHDAIHRVPGERCLREPARPGTAFSRAGKGGGIQHGAFSTRVWRASHA